MALALLLLSLWRGSLAWQVDGMGLTGSLLVARTREKGNAKIYAILKA